MLARFAHWVALLSIILKWILEQNPIQNDVAMHYQMLNIWQKDEATCHNPINISWSRSIEGIKAPYS